MSEGVLPEGWAAATLEELGDWGSGGTPLRTRPDYFAGGTIPWLKIGDLNDGIVTSAAEAITDLGLRSSSAKLLPKGVLLVAMYGSIGKLGITGISCATNQAIAFCQPCPDRVDLRFLFWLLRFEREALLGFGKGGTQQNISQTVLRGFEVPIPPLAEQQRVVAQVEKLLARVNAARERLVRVPAILKRFRQALLAAACEGRLTEEWRDSSKDSAGILSEGSERTLPASWSLTSGAQLFRWGSGKFLPKSKQRDGRYPIYGGNGVAGYHAECLTDRPTLVIGRVGALCGNIHLTPGPAWVTDNAIYASGVATGIDLRYISWVYSQADLNANAGGSGQPFVSQQALNEVRVPLPPEEEQHEIVRRVEALFKLADAIEKRVAMATARAEKLTQAILAKAFRGELVTTEAELARREGRAYEPAFALLGRVRGESAGADTKGDGRRGRAIAAGAISRRSGARRGA